MCKSYLKFIKHDENFEVFIFKNKLSMNIKFVLLISKVVHRLRLNGFEPRLRLRLRLSLSSLKSLWQNFA
jgi:hypothetical protein